MGGSIGQVLRSKYGKVLFGGLLIVSCVAGGIYLGEAIVQKPAPVYGFRELAPVIAVGDLFPLLNYNEPGNGMGAFDSLLMGKYTLLLFLSSDCGRCDDQLDFWNREVQPILRPEVQVVVSVRDSVLSQKLKRLIGPRKVIIPEKRVYELVGLKVTPTIIGVDEFGLVVYEQPGYSEAFGREFFERFAMTAK